MGHSSLNHENLGAVQGFYENLTSFDNYIEGRRWYENGALVQSEETVGACLSRTLTIIEAAGGHLPVTTEHGNVKQIVNPKARRFLTSHSSGLVSTACTDTSNLTFAGEEHMCCVAPTLRHFTSMPVPDRTNGEVLMCLSEQAQARA